MLQTLLLQTPFTNFSNLAAIHNCVRSATLYQI